ncbi:hypothetical protein [Roseovarius sp. MMSF_3350]|uniref:hypothetical protein n=1 Tax=Roseovarius sp. MMSF_3350 TaxID=3046706 RepID=UPI00273DDC8F|nr:hypothetical protein [Roseovarius sp. MMSF_3350]
MGTMPAFARFWMVCRKPTAPHHKTEPRQRYSTFADAFTAAKRLAQQNDAQFVILESIEIVRPGDAANGELF